MRALLISLVILSIPLFNSASGANARFRDPVTGMGFVVIKGGCFQMGNAFDEGDQDEKPVHEVCVSDFAIGQYDVTKGEFRKFTDSTGYRTDAEKGNGCYVYNGSVWVYGEGTSWRDPGFHQEDDHPAVCISWNDAVAFANWLSAKAGRRYRLPTEAEWEYAARSGGKRERFAGFSDPAELDRYANFCDANCVSDWKDKEQNDGFRYTSPVGSFRPNGLGLYDMTGNVWQWVADLYGERYYRESTRKSLLTDWYDGEARREKARNNPSGPGNGMYRVLRGGGWNSAAIDSRAAQRLRNNPEFRRSYIGVRLAASPLP